MKRKKIDPLKIYNVKQAADILGVNPQTLLDYLREGKIAARKIGEWKIIGQSLIYFLTKNKYTDMPLIESIKLQGEDTLKTFTQGAKKLAEKNRETLFEKPKLVKNKKLSKKAQKKLFQDILPTLTGEGKRLIEDLLRDQKK